MVPISPLPLPERVYVGFVVSPRAPRRKFVLWFTPLRGPYHRTFPLDARENLRYRLEARFHRGLRSETVVPLHLPQTFSSRVKEGRIIRRMVSTIKAPWPLGFVRLTPLPPLFLELFFFFSFLLTYKCSCAVWPLFFSPVLSALLPRAGLPLPRITVRTLELPLLVVLTLFCERKHSRRSRKCFVFSLSPLFMSFLPCWFLFNDGIGRCPPPFVVARERSLTRDNLPPPNTPPSSVLRLSPPDKLIGGRTTFP